jgi:hypothetical protein
VERVPEIDDRVAVDSAGRVVPLRDTGQQSGLAFVNEPDPRTVVRALRHHP